MQNRRLLTIFLIVLVDLLGFGLILPLLPFYAKAYGATPLVVGLLTASYAAAQLVGAPLLGRMSDRFGRRPVLLVSIFGTLLGFLLLGTAEPLGRALAGESAAGPIILGLLFLARVVDGLTGGNLTVAQAYITDVTTEKDRARGLGLIGAAFGLGFILGPAAGGLLSTWGYGVPAYLAAGLSAFNLLAVHLWLPESLTPEARARLQMRARPPFSLAALWQALNRPRVGPLLHVRFFFGLAFATFQSVFPLYALYRLALDARATGFVLTYVGVLVALVQGVAVGQISRRFKDTHVIMAGVVVMAFSLAAWSLAPNLWVLALVLVPLSLAGGTLNTVLSSALTKAVYAEEVGGTLGLAAAVESLTRVLAPTSGGWLLGALGPWAPGAFGAALMVWVVSFTWRRILVNPDPPLPLRGPALSGQAAD